MSMLLIIDRQVHLDYCVTYKTEIGMSLFIFIFFFKNIIFQMLPGFSSAEEKQSRYFDNRGVCVVFSRCRRVLVVLVQNIYCGPYI